MRVFNKRKRLLSNILCFFGEMLSFLIKILSLRIIEPTFLPENIRKTLIIEVFGIGDLILATPTFEALKEMYPKGQLHVLTLPEYKAIVALNPFLDEIIYFKCFWRKKSPYRWNTKEICTVVKSLRKQRYDMVIDFRGDFRNILFSSLLGARYRVGYDIGGGGFLLTHRVPNDASDKHQVLVNLDVVRYLGGDIKDPAPKIDVNPKDMDRISTILTAKGIERDDIVLGIHPGAANTLKKLSKEKLVQLVRDISSHEIRLLLIGSNEDNDIIDFLMAVNINGVEAVFPEKLEQLSLILKRLDLLICMDSGVGHIASAVGTPTISIFGPTDPRVWRPYGRNNSVIIFNPMPCRPCEQITCNGKTPCIDMIDIGEVTRVAIRKLRDIRA